MTDTIAVVVPTIPPRAALLERALSSVAAQTLQPDQVLVETDTDKEGPAFVRNRAASKAETTWLAFLDDDDELMPHHLQTLLDHQRETGADVVWPWFTVVGGGDPFPMFRGRQWVRDDPHIFPITALVRRSLFNLVGGFLPSRGQHPDGHETGEDFNLWLRLSDAGAIFSHTPETTWTWHHDSGNTSGLPSRW
jgi:glycosyltransferase involved in cell wall biosynthesis